MYRLHSVLIFAITVAVFTTGCGGSAPIQSLFSNSTSAGTITSTGNGTTSAPPTIGPWLPMATISVTPSSVNLPVKATQQFTATVLNSNSSAVDWTIVNCSAANCGTLTSAGFYTAPASIPAAAWVTIRAALHSDPSVSAFAYAGLQPVSVALEPSAMVRMATSDLRPFSATIHDDPDNSGVSWSVIGSGCSGDGCGTISDAASTSVVYHAPAVVPDPPLVILKATSITDTARSATAGLIISTTAAARPFQGNYAFLIHGSRGADLDHDEIAMAGHLQINADGSLVGMWDANLASGGVTESLTGSYALQSDGNGTLTLDAPGGTWMFALSVNSDGSSAALAPLPATPAPKDFTISSGYLLKQDANAFSMQSVAGDRVAALTFSNVLALGRFTADSAGTVSNSVFDMTWSGGYLNFFTTSTMSGSFSVPDPLSGRGTAQLTATPGPDAPTETFHFAYYIVSPARMLLMQSDASTWQWPLLRGEARYQSGAGTFSNASLNTPIVFNLSSPDAGTWWTPMAALGLAKPDAAGTISFVWDQNQQTVEDVTEILAQTSKSAKYTVAANGRVELAVSGLGFDTNRYPALVYLVDNNTGYFVHWAVFGTPSGYFEPQTISRFTPANLAGTYDAVVTGPPKTFQVERDAGMVVLTAEGAASVFLSLDRGGGVETFAWTGTYAVAENGRGLMSLTDATTGKGRSLLFWATSASRATALLSVTADDTYPILIDLRR